jgi:hypothetical protein
LQNIDAADAKDVGLNLRADIVSKLVQVGFDPAEVLKAVEMVPIAHTGVPSSQLQPISQIDPTDPAAAYDVREVNIPQTVVQIPESVVNVEAPSVNVEPPVVVFESPEVRVESPTVNVDAPKIEVTNTIEHKRLRKVVKRDDNNRITEIVEEFIEGDE